MVANAARLHGLDEAHVVSMTLRIPTRNDTAHVLVIVCLSAFHFQQSKHALGAKHTPLA